MLAVAISSFTAFASDDNVSSNVLSSFNKEFAGAKDVQWTTTSNYYKASFVFNDQFVSAFYQLDGELIATSRNISSLELPMSLQTNLKKNYNSYWISDLFEISTNDGTSYYITLDKADSKVVLKSSGNGNWETFRKTSKI